MKKLFVGFILICLYSCRDVQAEGGSVFYFDNPQPVNDSELSELPSGFRGTYNAGDRQRLVISDKIIYNETDFSETMLKSELDSVGGIYKNGKFMLDGQMYSAVEQKDSLLLTGVLKDTIFMLSLTQKAKRINGQLVLSTKDSVFWKVNIVSLQKDSLKIRHLSTPDDYIAIKSLVKNLKSTADTSVVNINPTRAEFRKILKIKKLGWEKGYKKIRS